MNAHGNYLKIKDNDFQYFVRKVEQLRAEGISIHEISRFFNVTSGTIRKRLRKYEQSQNEIISQNTEKTSS
jgi:transposase